MAVPLGKRTIDITNQRFGRLVAIEYIGCRPNGAYWLCKCDCGTLKEVGSSNLRKGDILSCGCYLREFAATINYKHGEKRGRVESPEYRAFLCAKTRCNNTNRKQYADYGGRGIEFRFESFDQFLAEVGRKPSRRHTLDRVNNDGHYEPGNVRWATRIEQARNKRTSHIMHANGTAKTLIEWAQTTGITIEAITHRLKVGWCEACAASLSRGQRCPHIVKSSVP